MRDDDENFELEQEPSGSREQRIRDLFESVGGAMTTLRFASVSVERGIWTQGELARFQLQAIQAFVRRALRALDNNGLPFAGQTVERDEDTGSPIWCQRVLWGFEDYTLNINDLLTQRKKLKTIAEGLIKECAQRYGKAPDVAA